jgi:putative ABC transport system permease protein
MPMTQHPFYANQIHMALRTEVKPLTLLSAVDERIARVDPRLRGDTRRWMRWWTS